MKRLDDPHTWRTMDTDTTALSVTTSNGARLTWVNGMAVVRSTFHINQDEAGQLMVVGPSRMNYDRIVAMLEYVSGLIEKLYSAGGDEQ